MLRTQLWFPASVLLWGCTTSSTVSEELAPRADSGAGVHTGDASQSPNGAEGGVSPNETEGGDADTGVVPKPAVEAGGVDGGIAEGGTDAGAVDDAALGSDSGKPPLDDDSGPKPLADCASIKAAYNTLVDPDAQTCTDDAECRLVNGSCGVGLGGCYHFVNPAVEDAALGALVLRWLELKCEQGAAVCACTEPPENIGCSLGICTEK